VLRFNKGINKGIWYNKVQQKSKQRYYKLIWLNNGIQQDMVEQRYKQRVQQKYDQWFTIKQGWDR
jgi:hypothetical protein